MKSAVIDWRESVPGESGAGRRLRRLSKQFGVLRWRLLRRALSYSVGGAVSADGGGAAECGRGARPSCSSICLSNPPLSSITHPSAPNTARVLVSFAGFCFPAVFPCTPFAFSHGLEPELASEYLRRIAGRPATKGSRTAPPRLMKKMKKKTTSECCPCSSSSNLLVRKQFSLHRQRF